MKRKLIFILFGLIVVVVFFMNFLQQKQLAATLPIHEEFPVYSLLNLTGQAYKFDKNRIKLITFFYSRCPDICPLTIKDLAELHEELKRRQLLDQQVDIIMITLDPEHDTVEELIEYSQSFNLPSEHLYILRGSPQTVMNLTDELGYYREEVAGYWSHSTTIYLVDYKNSIRAYHHMSAPNEPLDIQRIIGDIKLIQREYEKVENE